MERQNSLFDAAVSHTIPEPKAKQRKSKEKKRSYSIGRKPEVTQSKPEVNEPEIPKVISDTEYSIRMKSFRISPRRVQN